MDTLSGTVWDVVISGTGLPQSLLALALSKSDKKVLHIDKNDYYGGSEAALSLEEAVRWTERIENDTTSGFERPKLTDYTSSSSSPEETLKLGASRKYGLSLNPQVIYARSKVLAALVSSGTHRQLEFQAVGSWWLCKNDMSNLQPGDNLNDRTPEADSQLREDILQQIPSSREDVFADATLDVKSKRALMKFLRSMVKEENADSDSSDRAAISFSNILTQTSKIPSAHHDPLLALSLLPKHTNKVTAAMAISRIRRHLISIGIFGAGFAAVIPKWGGVSEIAQVGCRAGAVGGGTYVLGKGITEVEELDIASHAKEPQEEEEVRIQLELSNGETIKTKWLAASPGNVPRRFDRGDDLELETSARSISIVSSGLEQLFPLTSENGPIPACAIAMLPAMSQEESSDSSVPPIYLSVHSSDTGECPAGQCIIYASAALSDPLSAYPILDAAVDRLLKAVSTTTVDEPRAAVLWQLHYIQRGLPASFPSSLTPPSSEGDQPSSTPPTNGRSGDGGILLLPSPSLDLAFDDSVVDKVKEAWARIEGVDPDDDSFMVFAKQDMGEGEDE